MTRLRFLGVLLCYNDGDMLADSITHLLNNRHDVVVWNHGSTDETAAVLERFRGDLLEVTDISRGVDFYDIYPLMSKHLLANYVDRYDWISWPDQDEILEGPTRAKSYGDWLEEVAASRHNWLEFHDYIYWFTERDDQAIASPCERIRYYSLARHGSAKIRSWRAVATNIRWFNHNKAEGSRYPTLFNLRHYPMRTEAQMQRRLAVDRAGLQRGPVNYHYENMKAKLASRSVRAEDLHVDDGRADLNEVMKFDWSGVYGSGPKLPRAVIESYLLPTKRWEIARIFKTSFAKLPETTVEQLGRERLERWIRAFDDRISCPMVVALKKDEVTLVTEELSREYVDAAAEEGAGPVGTKRLEATLTGVPVAVSADVRDRSVRVVARESPAEGGRSRPPLVALVPCHGGESPLIAAFEDGAASFRSVRGMYYYLTCEP